MVFQPASIALAHGEHYAGVILKEDGTPDYHLVGLPGEIESATWEEAKTWAKSIGGELPTLRELGLERVNGRKHFQSDWYWSSEAHSSDGYAWYQDFHDGDQICYGTSRKLRARAVRRLAIL
ncbi:MAG: DUF1566 domain-containing protein [Pseudomonadota bacterium]|nr:DUF1566 domain-containing protein [Pseudomonadota bacterium]